MPKKLVFTETQLQEFFNKKQDDLKGVKHGFLFHDHSNKQNSQKQHVTDFDNQHYRVTIIYDNFASIWKEIKRLLPHALLGNGSIDLGKADDLFLTNLFTYLKSYQGLQNPGDDSKIIAKLAAQLSFSGVDISRTKTPSKKESSEFVQEPDSGSRSTGEIKKDSRVVFGGDTLRQSALVDEDHGTPHTKDFIYNGNTGIASAGFSPPIGQKNRPLSAALANSTNSTPQLPPRAQTASDTYPKSTFRDYDDFRQKLKTALVSNHKDLANDSVILKKLFKNLKNNPQGSHPIPAAEYMGNLLRAFEGVPEYNNTAASDYGDKEAITDALYEISRWGRDRNMDTFASSAPSSPGFNDSKRSTPASIRLRPHDDSRDFSMGLVGMPLHTQDDEDVLRLSLELEEAVNNSKENLFVLYQHGISELTRAKSSNSFDVNFSPTRYEEEKVLYSRDRDEDNKDDPRGKAVKFHEYTEGDSRVTKQLIMNVITEIRYLYDQKDRKIQEELFGTGSQVDQEQVVAKIKELKKEKDALGKLQEKLGVKADQTSDPEQAVTKLEEILAEQQAQKKHDETISHLFYEGKPINRERLANDIARLQDDLALQKEQTTHFATSLIESKTELDRVGNAVKLRRDNQETDQNFAGRICDEIGKLQQKDQARSQALDALGGIVDLRREDEDDVKFAKKIGDEFAKKIAEASALKESLKASQDENAGLQQEIDELRGLVSAKDAAAQQTQQDLEAIKAEKSEKDLALQRLEAQMAERQTAFDAALKAQMEAQKADFDAALKAQKAISDAALEAERAKARQAEEDLGRERSSNQSLQQENESLKSGQNSDLAALREQISALQAENGGLQANVASLTSAKDILAGQLGSLSSENTGLRSENANLAAELAALKAKNAENESERNRDLTAEIESLGQRLSTAERTLFEERVALEAKARGDLEKAERAHQDKLEEATASHQVTQATLTQKEEEIARLREENSLLAASLAASQTSSPEIKNETLTDLLRNLGINLEDGGNEESYEDRLERAKAKLQATNPGIQDEARRREEELAARNEQLLGEIHHFAEQLALKTDEVAARDEKIAMLRGLAEQETIHFQSLHEEMWEEIQHLRHANQNLGIERSEREGVIQRLEAERDALLRSAPRGGLRGVEQLRRNEFPGTPPHQSSNRLATSSMADQTQYESHSNNLSASSRLASQHSTPQRSGDSRTQQERNSSQSSSREATAQSDEISGQAHGGGPISKYATGADQPDARTKVQSVKSLTGKAKNLVK